MAGKSTSARYPEKPYRDPEVLDRLYNEEEMSMKAIAGKLDCAATSVSTWMDRHGIEKRSHSQALTLAHGTKYEVTYRAREAGHCVWHDKNDTVCVHRLLAVSEHGFESVKGKDVHHINGVPWDNRPDNLEIMERGKHRGYHHTKIHGLDRLRIAELYENGDISYRKLHDVLDYDEVGWYTLMHIHKECFGA